MIMARLFVHVEGETEETFVNEVLAPHLFGFGYHKVSARIIGNARMRDRRGGIQSWLLVRRDILNHLREDAGCLATTMVDYYALPQTGDGAWPGRQAAGAIPFNQKAATIENALLADAVAELDANFDSSRFIPFIMMHEFEGLLFSNCQSFGTGIGKPELAAQFQQIRDQFNSPEEINDSPITAPSKRVKALVPGYEKPLLGSLAILEIGLETIRAECPHFNDWISRLEAWPANHP
jgi:hypothetical protein